MAEQYCPACLDRWYANGRSRGPLETPIPSPRLPLHPECERALEKMLVTQ